MHQDRFCLIVGCMTNRDPLKPTVARYAGQESIALNASFPLGERLVSGIG
jgi:hypothetical protein